MRGKKSEKFPVKNGKFSLQYGNNRAIIFR